MKKNLLKSEYNFGFTLIELLVVIAVAMIIGSLSLASYSTFSRKQDVDQSALRLQSIFDEARFSALSNVRPSKCPAGYFSTKLYGVKLINNPTNTADQYKITAICLAPSDPAPAPPPVEVDVEEGSLPRAVGFGAFDCNGIFYYESISNKFYCTSTSALATGDTKIEITNGSDRRVLNITPNGTVTVN